MIYAIRTKTRREFAAVNAIRETGLAAYVPAETLRRRLGGKHRPIQRALLPGYAFVSCEARQLYALRGLDDVTGVIRSQTSQEPLPCDPKAIAAILLAELCGTFDHTTQPAGFSPKRGDRVRVKTGLWRDFIGRVVSVSKTEAHIIPDKGGRMRVGLGQLELAA